MQRDIVTVGLDLAKSAFQVYLIGADGEMLMRRQLRRAEVLRFFLIIATVLGRHGGIRQDAATGHRLRPWPGRSSRSGQMCRAESSAAP